jgi:ATP adenylyltransferase
MKNIWAPWRMSYIDDERRGEGCIFCDKVKGADRRAELVLAETADSLVMLNKFPYNNGHLLLAPKRHEKQLSALPAEEYLDLSETLRKSIDIVTNALRPGGINVGMNLGRCAGAGVEDHLHWHVVPRWDGDTNFMAVMGEVRVMPQHLLESYDRLKPYFTSI